MLNKVLGDESGALVDENFHNVGIGDHPLQDLMRDVLGDQAHRDAGRAGVSGNAADKFKFKTPTLRQARDAAPYMHDGGFATLRDVLLYFDSGNAKSNDAENAGTLDPLFTHPKGNGETGLGLDSADLDALEDFLANGLYDRSFVSFDANSTTDTFELNERDLTYSIELQLMGASNGKVPSGLNHPQTDPLTTSEMDAINGIGQKNSCGNFDLLGLLFCDSALVLRLEIQKKTQVADQTQFDMEKARMTHRHPGFFVQWKSELLHFLRVNVSGTVAANWTW
ncbi:MAG: hypothetical protein IPK83_19300 [Planctomycetes bacterium]|nr:hypothetical protein [Planctomycetota bacterium]